MSLPVDITLTDIQLEHKVLSTFYFRNNIEIVRENYKDLFPQVFTWEQEENIFKALKDFSMKNIELDMTQIYYKVEKFTNTINFTAIFDNRNILTISSFLEAILRLKELFFLRLSFVVSKKINSAILAKESSKIIQLSSTLRNSSSNLFGKKIISNSFEKAIDIINSKDEVIATAFPALNKLISGFTRKDLSSIGGKSGHNKTTFALFNAVESLKINNMNKLLYVSVDEPGEKIARRIIAKETGITLSDMRNKRVKLDKDEILRYVKTVFNNRLIILDTAFTPEEIQQAILDYKPDQTIVDHIQELRFPNEDGISENGITYSLKLFKEAARVTNSNCLVLSQVRDKVIDERVTDKIPRSHDFFYASTIKQKSREQCVVYWKYKDTYQESDFTVFEFYVYKSTYSETGMLKFNIIPNNATFTEVNSPILEKPIWET